MPPGCEFKVYLLFSRGASRQTARHTVDICLDKKPFIGFKLIREMALPFFLTSSSRHDCLLSQRGGG